MCSSDRLISVNCLLKQTCIYIYTIESDQHTCRHYTLDSTFESNGIYITLSSLLKTLTDDVSTFEFWISRDNGI